MDFQRIPKYIRSLCTTAGIDVWVCYDVDSTKSIGFVHGSDCIGAATIVNGICTTSTVLNKSDLEFIRKNTGFDILSVLNT
jgi:hypothetical protein